MAWTCSDILSSASKEDPRTPTSQEGSESQAQHSSPLPDDTIVVKPRLLASATKQTELRGGLKVEFSGHHSETAAHDLSPILPPMADQAVPTHRRNFERSAATIARGIAAQLQELTDRKHSPDKPDAHVQIIVQSKPKTSPNHQANKVSPKSHRQDMTYRFKSDDDSNVEDSSVIEISSDDNEAVGSESGLYPWRKWTISIRRAYEDAFLTLRSLPVNGSWEKTEKYQQHVDKEMLRYISDFPLDTWAIGEARARYAYHMLLDRDRVRHSGGVIYDASRIAFLSQGYLPSCAPSHPPPQPHTGFPPSAPAPGGRQISYSAPCTTKLLPAPATTVPQPSKVSSVTPHWETRHMLPDPAGAKVGSHDIQGGTHTHDRFSGPLTPVSTNAVNGNGLMTQPPQQGCSCFSRPLALPSVPVPSMKDTFPDPKATQRRSLLMEPRPEVDATNGGRKVPIERLPAKTAPSNQRSQKRKTYPDIIGKDQPPKKR